MAKKRELKQFGKIFTITIGANLFYLLWEILLAVEKRENIKEALLARFEERVPEDFILWNFSPLSPHLWYLQALLYVLVIAFIVEHLGLRKLAYLAIPVLLAGSLIKGSYSLFFVGKEDCHIYYARNFLYCGLPFFWLGCWFGSRKEDRSASHPRTCEQEHAAQSVSNQHPGIQIQLPVQTLCGSVFQVPCGPEYSEGLALYC